MSEKAQACIYCGLRATRWCDLVIGFTDPDSDGLCRLDDSHEILRCDAPLCEAHADHQGNRFFSGSPAVSGMDTVDHCIGHKDEGWFQDVAGGWMRNPERFKPISADEAERLRYRHRCTAVGLRLVPHPAERSADHLEG